LAFFSPHDAEAGRPRLPAGNPPTVEPVSAPELDLKAPAGGIALLIGGALLIAERRHRRRQPST
jgi:hypothetical protein